VGYASDGYQSVLITSNELLTCGHMGGEFGQTVMFHDTNGRPWTAVVTNVVTVLADMRIAQLSNAAPASIKIPWVLPPNYTNYFTNHSLVGFPAFWCHKNTDHLEYTPIVGCMNISLMGGFGTWMRVRHNGYGPFGNGTSATGGDSASPSFMIYNGEPVLLFAASTGSDAAGLFISGKTNWTALAASAVGTNGLRILDLSGYPTY
jgi:hypothetical protein